MFKESVIQHKRKREFEKKQRLKVLLLSNKFLGEWASNVLGYNELHKKKYISRISNINAKGTRDSNVLKEIEKDFIKNNVKISYQEIEFKIKDFRMKANVIVENNLKFNN